MVSTISGSVRGSVAGLERAALSELVRREDDQADVGESDEEPDDQANHRALADRTAAAPSVTLPATAASGPR
jgi:hypothetical protein